jgi:hypothetical protein
MQFIPGTWSNVGVDSDNDGKKNPQDIDDAATAAGIYLCAGSDDVSTDGGARSAVHRYNHSDSYVDLVMKISSAYAAGDFSQTPDGFPSSSIITSTSNDQTLSPKQRTAAKQQQEKAEGEQNSGGGSGGTGGGSTGGGTGGTDGGGTGGTDGGGTGGGGTDGGGTGGGTGGGDTGGGGSVVEPVTGILGGVLTTTEKTLCLLKLTQAQRDACIAAESAD